MATNKAIYDEILNIRGQDIMNYQDAFKQYLGRHFIPDTMVLDFPEDSSETWERLNTLHQFLFVGIAFPDYDQDGPPTHQQILNLCKWKYKIARSLRFINEADQKEENFQLLLSWLGKDYSDKDINEFLDGNGVCINDLEEDEVKDDFVALQTYAREKIEGLKKLSLVAQFDIEKAERKVKLRKIFDKNLALLKDLDVKIQQIEDDISVKEADYRGKLTPQERKDAISDELTKLKAQLTTLEITKNKLERLNTRVNSSLLMATDLIYNKNIDRVRRTDHWHSLYFVDATGVVNSDEIGYKIEDGKFVYQFLDHQYDANGNVVSSKVKEKEIATPLAELGLPDPPDFHDESQKSIIVNELQKSGISFDDHGNPIYAPKDLESSRNMQMVVDELNDDIARCESIQRFAEAVVDNPDKQLQSNSPVNNFVEVMSLIDMQSFDEQGKPYFRDEIVNIRTGEARENDARTRFGIAGQVVTRGVYINPGEIKRSTYVDPHSKDQQPKIVIETSHAKSGKDGQPVVQITNRSARGLSDEQKNLLAFKMAKEMLLQYREGDRKHKIVLKSKNKEHADQASRVYAALLMLTSADDPNQDRIILDPSQIEVHVPGASKPRFFTRTMDSKRQFYEGYFKDQTQRDDMRKEVTQAYRQMRQDIGSGRRDEKSHIKPDVSDDIHSINVDQRQIVPKK